MTSGQKFCTECGAALAPGMKFCTNCGTPAGGPGTATLPAPSASQETPVRQGLPGNPVSPEADPERILGIVPFIEQGLISVIHYTLVVTDRNLLFCTWNPDTDEEMSEADDAVMQESCDIDETADQIEHFRAKDWSAGPWQRYRSMAAEAIVAGSKNSITIPAGTIVSASIVCETRNSTQDTLHIDDGKGEKKFDLMYSQGPFLFRILQPLLGEKVEIADHLYRRRSLDRILTGQEYK